MVFDDREGKNPPSAMMSARTFMKGKKLRLRTKLYVKNARPREAAMEERQARVMVSEAVKLQTERKMSRRPSSRKEASSNR